MKFTKEIKNIFIIHSADEANLSKDEEDTINQALEAQDCLKNLKINAPIYNLDFPLKNNLKKLLNFKPDVIFNLVEAIKNKGKYSYLAPVIFDKINIPYTGNSKQAIKTTLNKILTKEILQKNNLPTPNWLFYENEAPINEAYIIKSVTEDASIGIDMNSVVYSNQEIKQLIETKTKEFGGLWFAEKYIEGREFNISILEKDNQALVLPCAEIVFEDIYDNYHRIVDYASKWDEDSPFYNASKRVFPKEEHNSLLFDKLTQICLKTWDIFKLSGYARIDFRVDKDNNPFILEINANPCIAKDSGFVAAAQKAGIDYPNLIKTIISSAKNWK